MADMTDEEVVRRIFEARFLQRPGVLPEMRKVDGSGGYADEIVNSMWLGFVFAHHNLPGGLPAAAALLRGEARIVMNESSRLPAMHISYNEYEISPGAMRIYKTEDKP